MRTLAINSLVLKQYLSTVLIFVLVLFVSIATYYMVQLGNTRIEREKKIRIDFRKLGIRSLYVLCIVLFFTLLHYFPSLKHLFNAFITSLVIAYVLNPAMKKLETYKYLNRRTSILLLFLIIFVLIFILLFSILPRTVQEFKSLVTKFPTYLERVTDELSNYSKNIFGRDILNLKEKNVSDVLNELNISAKNNMKGIVSSVKTTLSKIFIMVLIPIFVYYFLVDKELFIEKIKRLLPKKNKEKILSISRKVDERVVQYVKGKILMAIYIGVATGVFLGIIGVDFAFVIGLITMFADIIPYLGPLLGLIPAVIFAFIDSPIKALWVLLMYPFLQWTENNLIGPKILSDKIGIHPLFILIAILAGGFLYGFVGMIFILPLILALQVVYTELKKG